MSQEIDESLRVRRMLQKISVVEDSLPLVAMEEDAFSDVKVREREGECQL